MPFDNTNYTPVVQCLLDGYLRIEDKNNWCKGRFSTGKRFCAIGALYHGYSDLGRELILPDSAISEASSWLMIAVQNRGWRSVTVANDAKKTTHADILAIYREAIALAAGN